MKTELLSMKITSVVSGSLHLECASRNWRFLNAIEKGQNNGEVG